jgi:hypothetical protein
LQRVVNRSGWKALVLAAVVVTGCENVATERPAGVRLLTGSEMDTVTAGSASAMNKVEAQALGSAPQTTTFSSSQADSGGSPIAAPPFAPILNYASSQAGASASNGTFAQAGGSSQIQVDASGGAWINAAASAAHIGNNNGHAEINIQFTGISIGHVDLVYGSVVATACCGPFGRAQAGAEFGGGGAYKSGLQGMPISDMPGQVQGRIDAAVASSTLPLLDAGQALTVTAPGLSQSLGQ